MKCLFRVPSLCASKRTMWNYEGSNFDLFRNQLELTNFNECFDYDSIDDVCESVNEKLLKVAKETLVNKKVIIRPKDKPWFCNAHRKTSTSKELAAESSKTTQYSKFMEKV